MVLHHVEQDKHNVAICLVFVYFYLNELKSLCVHRYSCLVNEQGRKC